MNLDPETKLEKIDTEEFPLYRKRWLILFLYCIYGIASLIHWIQYSIIADVTVKYYSVSYTAVEWTSMIFSVSYIVFCVPGSYMLDKLGLRVSVLVGMIGTCLGTWLKVVAVDQERFWLALLSQSVIAIFQVLVLPIPPKLAAVWFGPNEVSFACTISAIGLQVGFALAFIVPPSLVKQGEIEDIQSGFEYMSLGIAIITTVIVVILYFFFADAPPTPPSFAQSQVQKNKEVSFNYKSSLWRLIKNKSFMILLIVYGVHEGVSIAIPVLLNQIILAHYPNDSEQVGFIGLTMMIFGIAGSFIYAIVIGKFGGLKIITWVVYITSTVATFLLVFLIGQGLVAVYMLAITSCIFWNIIFCVGYELGAEISYPEPEAASSGLLTISFQVFGVMVTYLYSYFNKEFSELAGNISLVVIVLLADSLLFFVKFDFKRSEADNFKITPEVKQSDITKQQHMENGFQGDAIAGES